MGLLPPAFAPERPSFRLEGMNGAFCLGAQPTSGRFMKRYADSEVARLGGKVAGGWFKPLACWAVHACKTCPRMRKPAEREPGGLVLFRGFHPVRCIGSGFGSWGFRLIRGLSACADFFTWLERAAGLEPASSAWKAEAQPLYQARVVMGWPVLISGFLFALQTRRAMSPARGLHGFAWPADQHSAFTPHRSGQDGHPCAWRLGSHHQTEPRISAAWAGSSNLPA